MVMPADLEAVHLLQQLRQEAGLHAGAAASARRRKAVYLVEEDHCRRRPPRPAGFGVWDCCLQCQALQTLTGFPARYPPEVHRAD